MGAGGGGRVEAEGGRRELLVAVVEGSAAAVQADGSSAPRPEPKKNK